MTLLGPGGSSFTRRVDVGPIRLRARPAAAPSHRGRHYLVHHDSFLVELPEVAGFDRVEVAYYVATRGTARHAPDRHTGRLRGRARRRPLHCRRGRRELCRWLSRVPASACEAASAPPGTVHWPEEYGDPDVYTRLRRRGRGARRASTSSSCPTATPTPRRRLMEQHAEAMVAYFRAKTPVQGARPLHQLHPGLRLLDRERHRPVRLRHRHGHGDEHALPERGAARAATSDNRCLYYGRAARATPNSAAQHRRRRAARARPRHDDRHGQHHPLRRLRRRRAPSTPPATARRPTSRSTSWATRSPASPTSTTATPAAGFARRRSTPRPTPSNGAWPEWIADLGAPRQGAPVLRRSASTARCRTARCARSARRSARSATSAGRSSSSATPRVSPTAPIALAGPGLAGSTPASGLPPTFSVVDAPRDRRDVTNDITWTLQGPGYPTPTTVATGATRHTRAFTPDRHLHAHLRGDRRHQLHQAVEVTAPTSTPPPGRSTSPGGLRRGPGLRRAGRARTDLDPCAATGVELTWIPATFGPDGGTYDIWRDGVRDRDAASSPRPTLDLPGDAALHTYRVRAVDRRLRP